jgi:hypothetical protein
MERGIEALPISKNVPVARKESAASVFNHCKRTETIIFQFTYPLLVVEGLWLTV